MDLHFIVLNISYILVTIGLLVRDMLLLRSMITISELLIIGWALTVGNHVIAGWNAVFLVINLVQIVRLIIERMPVKLPKELEDIYKNVFNELKEREFLYFWNTGKTISITDKFLCRENQHQDELMLILDGQVSVRKNGIEIAKLKRGSFVAEMSFMTGEPSSADVVNSEKTSCIVWSKEKLKHLQQLNQDLLMKLQVTLGKDLTYKLQNEIN
ncbi:cyclic nucleotide-binding domain-containing protein [Thermodesulfobacteriota bacterium]